MLTPLGFPYVADKEQLHLANRHFETSKKCDVE